MRCSRGISERALYCGLRFPLLPIIRQFLDYTGIALGQLDPNSFIHFNIFQDRCVKAEVESRLSLFFHHYDFKKNGKSAGFYIVAHRTDRSNWAVTNSRNKKIHDHWFYVNGPKLDKYRIWREVDPTDIIAPEMDDKDRADYYKIGHPMIPTKVPLSMSRDKEWLRSL